MLKKVKKISRLGLKKQADSIFSQIIRSGGECANCRSTYNLQCAHICSRRYLNLRWDSNNAVPLCSRCHMFFTFRPIEWDEWVTKRIGLNEYNALKQRALQIRKGKILYHDLISSLKTQLEAINEL